MAQQSVWGKAVHGWSLAAKRELGKDLEKLGTVPLEVLRSLSDRIARTYPACSVTELAIAESERSTDLNGPTLVDVASVLGYVFDKADGDAPELVAADLVSLELLPKSLEPTLVELIKLAQPLRKSANAAAANIRFGAPLFVKLRGTVDIRLQFNASEDEIRVGSAPVGLIESQRLIFANLTINRPSGKDDVIPFVMDEADLQSMKRFVRNMESALEISQRVSIGGSDNG